MAAGVASPDLIDCQQSGGLGGVWVTLAELRIGSKMGSFLGRTSPKTPCHFRSHSLMLPLVWVLSIVGVRLGTERERPQVLENFEKKIFLRKF